MSASLVGSEMCIRDSLAGARLVNSARLRLGAVRLAERDVVAPAAVSYTHLTLPDDMQCVDLG
eukprot:2118104-Alexandrium_andersonii.AAC.1